MNIFISKKYKQLNKIKKFITGEEDKEIEETIISLATHIAMCKKGKHNFLSYFNLGEKTHKIIFIPKFNIILNSENEHINNLKDSLIKNNFNYEKSKIFTTNFKTSHTYTILYNIEDKTIKIIDNGKLKKFWIF